MIFYIGPFFNLHNYSDDCLNKTRSGDIHNFVSCRFCGFWVYDFECMDFGFISFGFTCFEFMVFGFMDFGLMDFKFTGL